jgi:hypothetical protein
MFSGIFNPHTSHHNRKSIRLRGYDYSIPGAHLKNPAVPRDGESSIPMEGKTYL